MQEIHSTTTISGGRGGGGGGRVFGDRRMRPHSHQQMALKCPRCESPNTKFCYYNNYNLSQPRHFCKNCRRYWTKGGVLRNVPVGGGCRKSKRSSSSAKHRPSPSKRPLNSHSSSDSSTTTTSAAAAATAISGGGVGGGEGNYGGSVGLEPLMEANEMADRDMLMSAEIGGFMSYMSNSGGGVGGEGGAASTTAAYSEFLPSELAVEGCWEMRRQEEEEKMVESGMFDPTVRVDDQLQNRGTSGGLAALDWDAAADAAVDAAVEGSNGGLFDFSSAAVVDHHQSYWNQTTTSHAHHHQQHQHQHQWFDYNSNNGYSLFPDFLS